MCSRGTGITSTDQFFGSIFYITNPLWPLVSSVHYTGFFTTYFFSFSTLSYVLPLIGAVRTVDARGLSAPARRTDGRAQRVQSASQRD